MRRVKTLRASLVLPCMLLVASAPLLAQTSPGTTPATSARAGDGPPELEALRAPYLRSVTGLRTARDARIAAMTKSYVTNLERLEKEITAHGDLNGAVQVKAELERLAAAKEPTVAERKVMPPALVALRHQYENECEPVLNYERQQEEQQTKSYLTALDGLLKRLTVENKVDKALLVKAERDKPQATPPPSKVELTKRDLEKKVIGTTWVTASNSWVNKFAFGKGQVTVNPDKDGKGRAVSFHADDGATLIIPWDGGAQMKLFFSLDFSECKYEGQIYRRQ